MSLKTKHIIFIISVSIILKGLYLLQTYTFDEYPFAHSIKKEYITTIKKNDAYWYEKVVNEGYPELKTEKEIGFSSPNETIQSAWAFFPAYPILLKGTMLLTGFSFDSAAIIWSFLLSIMAFLLFYRVANQILKEKSIAFWCTILLMCYPFSFYFSMMYTEALFLIVLLLSFWAILKGYLFLLFLTLPVLVLTRATGLVMLGVLFLFLLEQNKSITAWKVYWKDMFSIQTVKLGLYFVPAVLTFIGYMYYNYEKTGFINAFSIAQKGWGRALTLPYKAFFNSGDLSTQFNSILTLLLIIVTFVFRKIMPLSMLVFMVITIMLPISTGSIGSMARFSVLMLPLFWYIFPNVKSVWLRWGVVFVALVGQMWMFYFWTIWHPLSY